MVASLGPCRQVGAARHLNSRQEGARKANLRLLEWKQFSSNERLFSLGNVQTIELIQKKIVAQ